MPHFNSVDFNESFLDDEESEGDTGTRDSAFVDE
jgi:hypothetical protein